MKLIVALALAVVLIGQSTTAWAGPGDSTPAEISYGVGSFFGTVVYTPFKGLFCMLGGIGSAGTLIFDPKMAGKVADTACRGTWVITPDNLKGKEQVKFVGDSEGR